MGGDDDLQAPSPRDGAEEAISAIARGLLGAGGVRRRHGRRKGQAEAIRQPGAEPGVGVFPARPAVIEMRDDGAPARREEPVEHADGIHPAREREDKTPRDSLGNRFRDGHGG